MFKHWLLDKSSEVRSANPNETAHRPPFGTLQVVLGSSDVNFGGARDLPRGALLTALVMLTEIFLLGVLRIQDPPAEGPVNRVTTFKDPVPQDPPHDRK